jgi:hypothetical protein
LLTANLKVSRIDEAAGIAEFSFVDITGSNAKGAHVQHVFIQLLEPDRLHVRFDFGGGTGPSGVEDILLNRVAPAKAPG